MASKIVVFSLILTICKVQSHAIQGYQNGATGNRAQSTANAQAVATSQQGNTQTTGNPQLGQTQTIPAQCNNGNTGITASPRLQIVSGQGNVQTIPLSQLTGTSQQRGQTQNYACNAARTGIQGNQIPQVQLSPVQISSPSLGIQPCLCGPSSAITAPISRITIPPTCATSMDDCLCTSLANSLQMLIANELISSAVGSNIINQDGVKIPLTEIVVPGVDLTTLCQSLNTNQQCGQTAQSQGSNQAQSYDWATIQNFLNQQNQQIASPVVSQPQVECTSQDVEALINYLRQNGRTIDQIANQPNQGSQQPTQCCQQNYEGGDGSNNAVLEALAAYLGCSTSEVSSNSYQNAPEIQFPAEIPAQLVCSYGYIPTTMPAVKFSVQPLNNACDGFIIGSQY